MPTYLSTSHSATKMYALIVICLFGTILGACQAANYKSLENRIVNGKDVNIEEFPYMLSIQIKNKFNRTKHICGGAIVSEYYGVSSKGCFVWFGTYNHSARSGSDLLEEGGLVTNITKVWVTNKGLPHLPRYHNDCAVFRVQDAFIFSPRVQSIRLPSTYSPVNDGTVATIAGWGGSEETGANSKHLKAVQVPTVELTECKKMNMYVRENNLCAGYRQGGKTFCGNDLGGPLVADGVLIGIATADYYCGHRPGEYGIYTKVSHYVNFIAGAENKL